MDDKQFLEQALMQSFMHPTMRLQSRLSFLDNVSMSGQYIIADAEMRMFAPVFLPLQYLKKHQPQIIRCVKQSNEILLQYQTLKHNINENIYVPETGSNTEINEIKQQFDLPSLSREVAQRKKVSATIFPPQFCIKYREIITRHQAIICNLTDFISSNKAAWDIVLIQEFNHNCQQIMRRFHRGNLAYRLNKRRFVSYLCEAVQYLKLYPTLPADFLSTHTLRLKDNFIFSSAVRDCYADLQRLLSLLQAMAGCKDLLNLAQNSLAGQQIYNDNFATYLSEHPCDKVEKVEKIYKTAQQLQDIYATLTYFDGVISAFENCFLAVCPEPRHQAIPTVSPTGELKKIRQIVLESQKIKPLNGIISKRFAATLKKYAQIYSQIQKMLQN